MHLLPAENSHAVGGSSKPDPTGCSNGTGRSSISRSPSFCARTVTRDCRWIVRLEREQAIVKALQQLKDALIDAYGYISRWEVSRGNAWFDMNVMVEDEDER